VTGEVTSSSPVPLPRGLVGVLGPIAQILGIGGMPHCASASMGRTVAGQLVGDQDLRHVPGCRGGSCHQPQTWGVLRSWARPRSAMAAEVSALVAQRSGPGHQPQTGLLFGL
jgi:hypothetical protein